MLYTIVAYPNGAREVVARLHTDSHREFEVGIVARMVGVSPGAEAAAIIAHAAVQARVRGEYVDVLREGNLIATVGAEGAVA